MMLLPQVDIDPSAEEVLVVPLRLAVTQEDDLNGLVVVVDVVVVVGVVGVTVRHVCLPRKTFAYFRCSGKYVCCHF